MNENDTPMIQQTRRHVLKFAGFCGFPLAIGKADGKETNDTVNLIQLGIKHQVSLNNGGSEKAVRYAVDIPYSHGIQSGKLYVSDRNVDNSNPIFSNEYVAVPKTYNNKIFESINEPIPPYGDSKIIPVEVSSDLRPVKGIPITSPFDHGKVRITPTFNGVVEVRYKGQQVEVNPRSSASIESEKQKVMVKTQSGKSESESDRTSATTIPSLRVKNKGNLIIKKKERIK